MKHKDESKRIAIVKKTMDIVFDKGFAGIKMAGLARMADISPSTIYVYYKNKQDLIVSITVEIIAKLAIHDIYNINEEMPYKLKLRSVWLHMVNFSINHSKEMSFLQQVKRSPYYKLVPESIREEKSKFGMQLLNKGKQEGLIKNIDNVILAAVIEANLSETVKLIENKSISLNECDMELMFGLVWDAIKS